MGGSGSSALPQTNVPMAPERNYEEVSLTIKERWVLQEKLGKGGYGVVYSAFDKLTQSMVAVKMELGYVESFGDSMPRDALRDEYEIMESIYKGVAKDECIGFPRPIYFARSGFMRVLVMERLGKTLHQTFNRRLPKLQSVYNVGIQLLNRLEHMHNAGFVHIDLKSDNIYIGKDGESRRVYLADFGLSECFRLPNGNHRASSYRGYSVGPDNFSSLNVMNGNTPSRRDDIISLGYNIICMYHKTLPWANSRRWHNRHRARNPQGIQNLILANPTLEYEQPIDSTDPKRHRGIDELKERYPLDKLCRGLPGMEEFMQHALSLQYVQKPDYAFLRRTLAGKIGLKNSPTARGNQ